jgi:hypothetical protein
MSKGGGQQTSTQTQTTQIDPAAREAFLRNLDESRQVAGGLNARQFADFTPLYTQGETQLQNMAQPFTAADIRQFQDPYETDVINAALGDVERSRQMQSLSNAQQATAAKAFGGSRYGVQEALTNEAALRNAGQLASTMRSQGYQTAAQLAQNARNLGLQGAGALMTAGGARQDLEQQRLDAIRNLGLERLGISSSALGLLGNLGNTTTGTTSQPLYRNAGAGALGGALAGAKLGSIVPGIGTGIGAGVGGLLGLFG